MYLPRYTAFFLFLCLSKGWGRTIVWPPKEEYLDSDIESLFRDFSVPQTTAYPPPRSYPDLPRLTTAYPPPQRRNYESISSREAKLYSRIRSTTEHPSSSSHTDDQSNLGNQYDPVPQESQVSNPDNTSTNEPPSYQSSVADYERAAAYVGPSNQSVPSKQQRIPSQSRYHLKPWYKPTRVNCRHVEKVVKVQQCEPYTMETCWTEAKQECYPQPVTNCTGMIDTRLEQVCFNVEDELCTLVETVDSEKSEDSYQTQHCFIGRDGEVCGSSYEVQQLKMDDYGCTSVNVLNCHQVAQYTHDVNSIESVEFDCKEDGYQPNTMLPRITCTPNPTKKIYKIPRKVVTEVCEITPSRYCEAFVNNRAVPAAKEKCKPYIKKSCDFKIETSPKISKKFKYEKVCRKKSREICEHVETRAIVPKCETSERLSCVYVAHQHQCKHDLKHYCHLVDKVVSEEVCDTGFGYSQQ